MQRKTTIFEFSMPGGSQVYTHITFGHRTVANAIVLRSEVTAKA